MSKASSTQSSLGTLKDWESKIALLPYLTKHKDKFGKTFTDRGKQFTVFGLLVIQKGSRKHLIDLVATDPKGTQHVFHISILRAIA